MHLYFPTDHTILGDTLVIVHPDEFLQVGTKMPPDKVQVISTRIRKRVELYLRKWLPVGLLRHNHSADISPLIPVLLKRSEDLHVFATQSPDRINWGDIQNAELDEWLKDRDKKKGKVRAEQIYEIVGWWSDGCLGHAIKHFSWSNSLNIPRRKDTTVPENISKILSGNLSIPPNKIAEFRNVGLIAVHEGNRHWKPSIVIEHIPHTFHSGKLVML